jgi:hypothetical protein
VETGLLALATVVVIAFASRLFRRRCPMCAQRAVVERSGILIDRVVNPPTMYWEMECLRCKARFASGDGRTLIPRDAWDAGVRGSFDATARVVKEP